MTKRDIKNITCYLVSLAGAAMVIDKLVWWFFLR